MRGTRGTVICETHRHGNTDRRLYFVCAISPYDPSRLSRAVFVSFVGVCPGLYSSRVSRQLESRFLLIITTLQLQLLLLEKNEMFSHLPPPCVVGGPCISRVKRAARFQPQPTPAPPYWLPLLFSASVPLPK